MCEWLPWILLLLALLVLAVLAWWWTGRTAKVKSSPAAKVEAPAVSLPKVEAPHVIESVPIPDTHPPKPIVPDDLEIIEGIGPKIAGILTAAGIETFAQLAETPVSKITSILNAAGLRLFDAGTWAEQAKLAAAGKMDDLRRLQESLKGGRRA
jgi:large subunit ribosomal protein L21